MDKPTRLALVVLLNALVVLACAWRFAELRDGWARERAVQQVVRDADQRR